MSYTYDANGNIETITEAGKIIKYYYNELNELIREDNQVLDKTIAYSYDAGGNIESKSEYAYTTDTVLSNPVNTISYTYGDGNWKDKLTAYNGIPITYATDGKDIGNPLTYDGYTYTWEEGRQLKTISGNGLDISFKYNSEGIRTEKKVGNVVTKYHLTGDKVTFEDNGTDKIYYTYGSDGNLVSMNLNGVEYYYVRNAQGDIIGILDGNGTEVVSYVYDSWGKLVSTTGTLKDTIGVKNPYKYRGYRYDIETGLYYLQSRYYNPEWGRFINADGLVGTPGELLSHNMFIYCMNNPVNMSDPSGRFGVSALFGSIAQAVVAAVGAITVVVESPVFIVAAVIVITGALIYEGVQLYKAISESSSQNKSNSNIQSTNKSPKKRKNKPLQNGKPNSKEVVRDKNGDVEKYTEFGPNGEFSKEVRLKGKEHGPIPRPNVKEPNFNTNPVTGEKFQNGYTVRPATPEEINIEWDVK